MLVITQVHDLWIDIDEFLNSFLTRIFERFKGSLLLGLYILIMSFKTNRVYVTQLNVPSMPIIVFIAYIYLVVGSEHRTSNEKLVGNSEKLIRISSKHQ